MTAAHCEQSVEFGAKVALSGDGHVVAVKMAAASRCSSREDYVLQTFELPLAGEARFLCNVARRSGGLAPNGIALNQDGNVLADAPAGDGKPIRYERHGACWSGTAPTIVDNPFLTTVALSSDGNVLAAGAPFNQNYYADNGRPLYSGYARVYGTPGGDARELAPGHGIKGSHFGAAIAMSGDGGTLFVGEPEIRYSGEDHESWPANFGEGKVTAFGVAGSQKLQELRLAGAQIGDHFGSALAVSADGSTLAVATQRVASPSVEGEVHLWKKDASGRFQQIASLTPSKATCATARGLESKVWDQYTWGETLFVSRDGGVVVVNLRYRARLNGSPSDVFGGAVHLFYRQMDGRWLERVIDDTGFENAGFGGSFALDATATSLVVGVPLKPTSGDSDPQSPSGAVLRYDLSGACTASR